MTVEVDLPARPPALSLGGWATLLELLRAERRRRADTQTGENGP